MYYNTIIVVDEEKDAMTINFALDLIIILI